MRLMGRICRAEVCGIARRTKQRWRITGAFGGHPLTPEDAAGLLWTAMHCQDPVLFLDSETHVLGGTRKRGADSGDSAGKARKRQAGSDVTLIAWGDTVEKALEAIQQIENEASIELIDLRSISPWDHDTIEESVRKTGRVLIVQEDTENCSVGQMIITHLDVPNRSLEQHG